MRCRRVLLWNKRGALRLGAGGVRGAAIAGFCVLAVGNGGTAVADERPREPQRRGELAWSHTNQDNIAPPPPNVIVDHTNQDKEERKDPGGEGDEEKKRDGFAMPSDPQRPLHLLMHASWERYSVLPIHLVAGAPVLAPLEEPMSLISGDAVAASDFALQMIPGPGALAPLIFAGLFGGRGRRRSTTRGRTDS